MTTLIIGGGLSGLALAARLEAAGQDYHLLDARDRWGGRILTEHHGGGAFDLGPAWFWPGQPRMAALLRELGLRRFDQFAAGDLMFEDAGGQVQRGVGFASMEGSWRVEGGLGALVDALASRLPSARKQLNAQVMQLSREERCAATLRDGRVINGDRVVLALPPRIAAGLAFSPALPRPVKDTMNAVPTWMAGQAKAIAIYRTPFWRAAGLSGDAMSRRGPLVEIHDASPAEGGPYALFGFIGVPAQARTSEDAMRRAIKVQLARLFGEDAATPTALLLKDWARDPLTATAADAAPLYAHPTYGLPAGLSDIWDGHLIMAGTEVAPQFGGYLEGALEAADAAAQRILGARSIRTEVAQ